jgi:hypothetical protein
MLLSKGKGKPIDRRSQRNQTTQVAQYLVPDVATAANNYEGMGGQLTRFPSFGVDPLLGRPEGQQRRDENFEAQFDVAAVFGSVVNGVDLPFRTAIQRFANISRELADL